MIYCNKIGKTNSWNIYIGDTHMTPDPDLLIHAPI